MVKESPTIRDSGVKKRRKTAANTESEQEIDVYKVSFGVICYPYVSNSINID